MCIEFFDWFVSSDFGELCHNIRHFWLWRTVYSPARDCFFFLFFFRRSATLRVLLALHPAFAPRVSDPELPLPCASISFPIRTVRGLRRPTPSPTSIGLSRYTTRQSLSRNRTGARHVRVNRYGRQPPPPPLPNSEAFPTLQFPC